MYIDDSFRSGLVLADSLAGPGDSALDQGPANMAISKGKRYNVFARDEFTCQYCGRRPPEVILEVDHIHPTAKGGTDDDVNLVTSCMECNRGKSAKLPGQITPRPDADLKYLKAQQEIAEAQRYLEAKGKRDEAFRIVAAALEEVWVEMLPDPDKLVPTDYQWHTWLNLFSPDEIDFAIRRCGDKWGWQIRTVSQAIRYVSGILHKARREESGR